MKPDILYAITDDGSPLPIIDVTHPAFAVTATAAEIATMAEQFLLESTRRQATSEQVRAALEQATLGRALIAASGTFLSGMNTYLFKLGPNNLGANANPIDQHIAGSFPAFTMRLRLQDMARMLADGLAHTASQPQRPLCFINIAGGPGADTWNALIYLQTEHPELLADRTINTTVLDLDDHGPSFGQRALDVLCASPSPLSGLNITFQHLPYNWSQTDLLKETLTTTPAIHSQCAISSEGGLFEYGSDKQITENLQQLHAGTAPDAFVVGSVTRDGPLVNAAHSSIQIPTRPRTLEAFQQLVTQAGWSIQHVIERPMSYNLRLTKA
jgi:hypothetical protein